MFYLRHPDTLFKGFLADLLNFSPFSLAEFAQFKVNIEVAVAAGHDFAAAPGIPGGLLPIQLLAMATGGRIGEGVTPGSLHLLLILAGNGQKAEKRENDGGPHGGK